MIHKKLNAGCGNDIRKGWVNLDYFNKKADYIWDLRKLPLPFKDNEFDYIYCNGVLEDFTEPAEIILEFIRICKVGGRIELMVPFETGTWRSIRHKHPFTLTCLKSFVYRTNYGKPNLPVKIIKLKYEHDCSDYGLLKTIIIKPLTWLQNIIPYKYIELTPLKFFLFPLPQCKCIYEKK